MVLKVGNKRAGYNLVRLQRKILFPTTPGIFGCFLPIFGNTWLIEVLGCQKEVLYLCAYLWSHIFFKDCSPNFVIISCSFVTFAITLFPSEVKFWAKEISILVISFWRSTVHCTQRDTLRSLFGICMLCRLFGRIIVGIHALYDLIVLYFSFEDTNKERNLTMPCGHGLKTATIFTQILKVQLILIFSHCSMIHRRMQGTQWHR